MKRTFMFLAPPLAFALAAILAWLTGAPADDVLVSGNSVSLSPRQREVVAADSRDLSATLVLLERMILHHPVPPVEIHDAEGMEAVLDRDDRSSGTCGGGMASITYSMEWAEEAPEAMFAWLIDKGGSSSDRKLFPAYILFGSWAGKDMKAALSAVSKIQNRNLRQQALISSLEILCKSDPSRARELMLQNLSVFAPDGRSPIFNWHETGKITCEMLLSLPPGKERTQLLAKLLTDMAGSNEELAGQATELWQRAPADLRLELAAAGYTNGKDNASSFAGLADLMRENAETSGVPTSAEKFIDVHGPDWAKRDLAGALDWTRTYLKGRIRAERGAGLFEFAAGQDFDAALGIWQTLPEGFMKVRAAEALSKGAPAECKADAILIGIPSG
jgi:hypothetical protein